MFINNCSICVSTEVCPCPIKLRTSLGNLPWFTVLFSINIEDTIVDGALDAFVVGDASLVIVRLEASKSSRTKITGVELSASYKICNS